MCRCTHTQGIDKLRKKAKKYVVTRLTSGGQEQHKVIFCAVVVTVVTQEGPPHTTSTVRHRHMLQEVLTEVSWYIIRYSTVLLFLPTGPALNPTDVSYIVDVIIMWLSEQMRNANESAKQATKKHAADVSSDDDDDEDDGGDEPESSGSELQHDDDEILVLEDSDDEAAEAPVPQSHRKSKMKRLTSFIIDAIGGDAGLADDYDDSDASHSHDDHASSPIAMRRGSRVMESLSPFTMHRQTPTKRSRKRAITQYLILS